MECCENGCSCGSSLIHKHSFPGPAFATVQKVPRACRPEARALATVEKYIVGHAQNMTPTDVKEFLVAFAAMEAPPQPLTVNTAILTLPSKFSSATPQVVSHLLKARPLPSCVVSQRCGQCCSKCRVSLSVLGPISVSTLRVGCAGARQHAVHATAALHPAVCHVPHLHPRHVPIDSAGGKAAVGGEHHHWHAHLPRLLHLRPPSTAPRPCALLCLVPAAWRLFARVCPSFVGTVCAPFVGPVFSPGTVLSSAPCTPDTSARAAERLPSVFRFARQRSQHWKPHRAAMWPTC